MRHVLIAALICALPLKALAQDHAAAIDAALETHVLPGVARLAEVSAVLAETALTHCTAGSPELRDAYTAAFDAWVHVSHLRFGPFEAENRAFALAFWPDSRGATPRALTDLLETSDPVVEDVESFATVSIAARGFYGLEFFLYDELLSQAGDADYRCALVQVMSEDIAQTTEAILDDWQGTHAALMRAPGPGTRYQSEAEVMRALFNALTTGLEFNADVRLGRPLGTFERPRPTRAEARRSGRSVRHLQISLTGLEELAVALLVGTQAPPDIASGFAAAQEGLARLEDPALADVATPGGRVRVEGVQQRIAELRQSIFLQMGPSLGVSAGFNALDGD